MQHDERALELAAARALADERKEGPSLVQIPEIPSVFDLDAKPPNFVVEGMFAEQTLGMVSGGSGEGKTTVLSSLGWSVANGELFAGLQTSKRPVLFLDRENPLPIVQERNARLGICDGARDYSEFLIWGGWLAEEAPDPAVPRIVEWAATKDPKPLIIVDSLVAFLGCDENNATEVRARLHQWRALVNLGCTLIVLHHSGKGENTKDYRGSSDIKASIDVGYSLANIGSDPNRLETVRLRCWKSRILVHSEVILRQVGAGFERVGGSSQMRTNHDLANEVLQANPGLNAGELEDLIIQRGVSQKQAREITRNWQNDPRVTVTQGKRNARFYRWKGGSDDLLQ